jgi:hypothetical protein
MSPRSRTESNIKFKVWLSCLSQLLEIDSLVKAKIVEVTGETVSMGNNQKSVGEMSRKSFIFI